MSTSPTTSSPPPSSSTVWTTAKTESLYSSILGRWCPWRAPPTAGPPRANSFCIGQPDFPAPLHVQEAGIRAIREGKHGYTPSAGIDPLREAAAKYMAGMRGGLPIRAEDVVVGAGAKPFIAYAILSVTDYGV